MDSSEPQIQTQTMQKANSSKFLTCFEAEGENYLSWTVTAYETRSLILNWRQKGNPWKSTKFKSLSADKSMITVC
jgi:leucyl aminopeptidase (aminopeptidase T)